MGPFQYGSWARILDRLTSTENETANAWRKLCWPTLARRSKCRTLKAGVKIKLHHPIKFTDRDRASTPKHFALPQKLVLPIASPGNGDTSDLITAG